MPRGPLTAEAGISSTKNGPYTREGRARGPLCAEREHPGTDSCVTQGQGTAAVLTPRSCSLICGPSAEEGRSPNGPVPDPA